MNSIDQQIIAAVLRSMEDQPDDWQTDKWSVSNKRLGARVWLANNRCGLDIRVGDYKIGGVTFASSLFGMLIPWRIAVYAAGRKLQDRLLSGQPDIASLRRNALKRVQTPA